MLEAMFLYCNIPILSVYYMKLFIAQITIFVAVVALDARRQLVSTRKLNCCTDCV